MNNMLVCASRRLRRMLGTTIVITAVAVTAHAAFKDTPTARKYYDWLRGTFDIIEQQMPQITGAAEITADGFIEGKNLGVRGGAGLNEELGARAGGLCVYRCRKGEPGDVILYAFGVATERQPDVASLLEQELADAEALAEAGSPVIGLASLDQLSQYHVLDRARQVCRVLLDNHCPARDGLFTDSAGKSVIPSFTTANAAVAWPWMAEFFAACTRRGKTPAMYQSILADPERERYAKYVKVRFHDDMHVDPVPAGQFGRAYLDAVRRMFGQIETEQWANLEQAAQAATQTLRDGGKVFIFARGHYPPYHHAGQLVNDPRLYEPLQMRRIKRRKPTDPELPIPGANDYGIAVGYSLPPGDEFWGGADEMLRRAGKGVCWIISGYQTRADDLRANETLIDQCWPDGDAAVPVEGYDVPICPPSGVISEALMWMLTAEVYGRLHPDGSEMNDSGP